MAAFAAKASGTIDATGTLLTLKDDSDYAGNAEGYPVTDFTRSFVLTDAYGGPLATLPFTGSALTVPYTITADGWIVAELILLGHGDYSNTVKIPGDRIAKNTYRIMLQQGCCANNVIDKRLAFADLYLFGCEIEELAGNGPGFNVDIAAANAYLNGPKF